MKYFLRLFVCALAAFIASLVVLDNSGVGTLGEWAGAIASFGAIMIALNGNRIILSASFVLEGRILEAGGIRTSNDLNMVVENKSNFDVQVDTMTVIFKTRFLKRNLGEYVVEQFFERPMILNAHKIYKSKTGFSLIGNTLPIAKHKKVLADAAIYYANKKTTIKVNQLVYMDNIIAKKI